MLKIDLQISQSFGRIGLNIERPRYELNQKKPELEIKQKNPEVKIETVRPQLDTDFRPALGSMGFGGIWFMADNIKQNAEAAFQRNLDITVQTGRRIGEIEHRERMGDIIFQALTPPESDVTIALLAPVQISYVPAQVHFSTEPGEVKYTAVLGKVSIEDFAFPSVRAYLEQEPFLEIKAIGQAIDIKK